MSRHEPSCTCEVCSAWRYAILQANHPLMGKDIKPTRVIVPVEQAIAQLCEARDCYVNRIAEIDLQLRDLRDI
jgi:hypothetical protein